MMNRLAEYNNLAVSVCRARQDRNKPWKSNVGGGSYSDAPSLDAQSLSDSSPASRPSK
jgi:hypothetical protein